ncbi:helix-turn-helix domain-containing protein [Xenorhabdus sp. 12]|uniref:Helix-turn-helix domain-containing protein n=1 Tax=Xenorhabdus santafensis TaxID=2582833 RepID=A0ABU4S7X5_9GAMM|nr:helix-turn-helix domain-containing protein [Xenorhabdus sp. 12]MDX7986886.1 helix-turn-helix domain-containing protein [Xenorhabdus sp. 12]
MKKTSVAIIVTEGFSTFHLSVPLIFFGGTMTDKKLFTRLLCAEKEGIVWSKEGTAVNADYNFDAIKTADIVIIPFWEHVHEPPSESLINAIIAAKKNGSLLVGLCLGTFVLAYAGVLDGHRAATHWEYESQFQQLFPQVKLDVNVLYTEDNGIITSAGTAAALDCCLYIVRHLYGAKTANEMARKMITPPHRNGGQAQYIEQIVPHSTTNQRINQLLDYLLIHLQDAHSIDSLAEKISMSRRTLTRHFHKATGMSIGEWLTTARLHRSQELLENPELSIEQVSELAGFQSSITFRQIFKEKSGVSPIEWRRTFIG